MPREEVREQAMLVITRLVEPVPVNVDDLGPLAGNELGAGVQ